MKLLALDTSTAACSVALCIGERMFERHEVQPKQHTRLLVPMIDDVLRQGGAMLRDLDAVVLGNGPGSFIGMRIAASVAQGLCYGAGLKLVPVCSLAAVAAESFENSTVSRVLVAQDAHMSEVYLRGYRRGEDGLPLATGETTLQPIAPVDVPDAPDTADWYAAGAGWQRYPELMKLNDDRLAGSTDVEWPRAQYLLGLGRRSCLAGKAIDPASLVPAYVRDRVAA